MSSVFGLNASPHSANARPERSAPSRATILSTSTCFCASFTASPAPSSFSGWPSEVAVCCSAFTSFGKQLPP